MPLSTWSPFARIGRPLETHNVRTPENYFAAQRNIIAINKAGNPSWNWREPFECDDPCVPFVNAGRWVVLCPCCPNAPSYDPIWKLALCCECGAILRPEPPVDWQEIDCLLMLRPAMVNRHWIPMRDETLITLYEENEAHRV